MTPKQLRELDARIGQEIMGYNVQPLENFLVGQMRDDGYDYCVVNEHGDPGPLPAFTTDMNAAIKLVKKVISIVGGTVEMVLEEGGWWVIFKAEPGTWQGWKELELPLAICLAALEAVKK